MTEKQGVLLVDVPEPSDDSFCYLEYSDELYSVFRTDDYFELFEHAYKCTEEEAKKYPQFRWVSLEELK